MPLAESAPTLYVDTFFARQPVFRADTSVFGYELLYRSGSEDDTGDYSDEDAASLLVLSSALASPAGAGKPDRKAIVHFSERSLLTDLHAALPPESTALIIKPRRHAGEGYLQTLRKARSRGFTLMLDSLEPDACDPALLELARVVCLDLAGQTPQRLADAARALKTPGRQLLARGVEDDQGLRRAKDLGFDLFQGFFFARPVIVPGRKLPTGRLARLSIHKTLGKGEDALEELARVIESDVSVSYRLLTFINSASFSARQKVSSIRHALNLLGWRKVRGWLLMVVLSELLPKGKPSELPYLSTIRARFLERASSGLAPGGVTPDTLFLMGLFSLLEPMLDTPMPELVDQLPLDDAVKDALSGKHNGFTPWLHLARCFETGDWSRLDELTTRLSLDPVKVASSYCEALVWAKALEEQASETP
ncbi:hypothetical protein NNJEOMEG_01487 [Fundidesulfovibrio magnetotacticus]|uniref:HDOD domain-containing protein n=1 Tax=Fundidesulfovibrio magnetotacticus TaxID=2730080 RepID=A0A6V8LLT8_9BACT|nr:HDOD domain-containing protein [Fundidesulfovibrio magnetotacticus]GFK93653.1 hypothetical protein NNJEOMEG_01487 [Fundidesulfovibrio magnetotacticus]